MISIAWAAQRSSTPARDSGLGSRAEKARDWDVRGGEWRVGEGAKGAWVPEGSRPNSIPGKAILGLGSIGTFFRQKLVWKETNTRKSFPQKSSPSSLLGANSGSELLPSPQRLGLGLNPSTSPSGLLSFSV